MVIAMMFGTEETAAAAEDRLRTRIAAPRARLGACTRKLNEIRALMTDDGNVDDVNDTFETF